MHECKQEETIGKFKEFMSEMKGFKATLFTIALAIILQVGTFLYLWGGLTTTVKNHDKLIETVSTKIDKVLAISYANAHEKNALPELQH